MKMECEYQKLYGNIPSDPIERISPLLTKNLSRVKTTLQDEIKRISSIKWNQIHFTIFLVPKATPRPRSSGKGFFYVKGANDNKAFFKKYAKEKDITLITTPTKFVCRCYLPIPKSMNSLEKILAELGFIYPTSKPDADNLVKTYCDMIQDTILYDDSLVVKMVSEKYYSTKPRIEIDISFMEDYDSQFNKKKIEKG